MGSGTGFSSEFSEQVNFTWFTWLCSFFYFIYGLKDLTNALCKVVCDYTTVQGRWFHMGGYVQFMYEWVKWSSHKTGLCIHLIKKTPLKSSFRKSLHYRNFSRWCIPKKVKKKFPVFLMVHSHLNLCKAHQRSLQLNNNTANIHFKAFLGDKKTTTSLKQSTLRICICSLWQCKLCLKEFRISFANEHIPINARSLIIHG